MRRNCADLMRVNSRHHPFASNLSRDIKTPKMAVVVFQNIFQFVSGFSNARAGSTRAQCWCHDLSPSSFKFLLKNEECTCVECVNPITPLIYCIDQQTTMTHIPIHHKLIVLAITLNIN